MKKRKDYMGGGIVAEPWSWEEKGGGKGRCLAILTRKSAGGEDPLSLVRGKRGRTTSSSCFRMMKRERQGLLSGREEKKKKRGRAQPGTEKGSQHKEGEGEKRHTPVLSFEEKGKGKKRPGRDRSCASADEGKKAFGAGGKEGEKKKGDSGGKKEKVRAVPLSFPRRKKKSTAP